MSKITELKRLEAEHETTQLRIEQLRKELEGVGAIVEGVRREASAKGLDLLEICYALVPTLEPKGAKSAKSSEPIPRQKRRVKRYTNPHNGEMIETKGGNNKVLQEWKKEHGNDTVESWAEFLG
jgi:hypothetical protein